MGVLLKTDEGNAVPVTEGELRRGLAGGKTTAPGNDGVTYSVFCLLQEVSGNPLLRLYNLCFCQG